jgi:hypothetical protein
VKYETNAFAKNEKSAVIDINKQHKKSLLKYTELRCDFITYLKLKENLGGFVSMEQMNDVWGIS